MMPWTSRTFRAALFEMLEDYSPRRSALGPFKLVAKGARMAWHWRRQRVFLHSIGGRATRQLLTTRPRMALRPHAKYLFRHTVLDLRVRLLVAHYTFMNRVYDAAQFARLLDGHGFRLWSLESEGGSVAIRLSGPPHHHEGELSMRLLIDDVVVFQLAFSVVPRDCFGLLRRHASTTHAIYIGQVQGAPGEMARIRQATQSCMAIAPQDLLMNALAGIAVAWDIALLLGVAAERRLAIDKVIASPQTLDYTAFWARYQSFVSHDGHHVIEVPFPQKPIGQIVARHRKRTLRKRRFKQALIDEVARTMAGSMRSIR